jgi:hypothetical protein
VTKRSCAAGPAAQAPAALVQRTKLRLLAAELGISHSTVARVWAEHDLKPWQTETFKFSTEAVAQARMVWLRGGQVANALGSFGR